MAGACKSALRIGHDKAIFLGVSAVEVSHRGYYFNESNAKVDWSAAVEKAQVSKVSLPPSMELPKPVLHPSLSTNIQVGNETTLKAAKRLSKTHSRVVALNFANGMLPGGGFLIGAQAQEEALCRSSALHKTLQDDPMYEHHIENDSAASSDWMIYSPDVPVFRQDCGTSLYRPWNLSFITAAAPFCPTVGPMQSRELLKKRIIRVLEVASAYGYQNLVLGAWGCGAFGNDPHHTAIDFRNALEQQFSGRFLNIFFAIADWSNERHFLGPFRDVFSSNP